MYINPVSFQQYKALSIYELSAHPEDSFQYISGDTAIREKKIEVNEISESGSVNNIFIFNQSDDYIFFMDGDILEGAKQNRVINTSIFLAPKTKNTIPVSCVEQGRWNKQSDQFKSSDYTVPTMMRASKASFIKKNLDENKGHYADQSKVWEDVEHFSVSYCVSSPTSNLSDVVTSEQKTFDQYVKKFKPNEDANGMALFIKNRLLHIDIFNRRNIYAEYFPKMIKGAAVEAHSLKIDDKNLPTEAEIKFKTMDFLDRIALLPLNEHPGIGVGRELRFDTEEMTGFSLKYKDELIHFTAMNLKK